MTMTKQEIKLHYTALLRDYVQSLDEKHLANIENLGQEMVLLDWPPEEIGEIHDYALNELLKGNSGLDAKLIRAISLPLMQLLVAYGVAFRSLLEKNKAESSLHLASRAIAETLEGIIITNAKGAIVDTNKAFEDVTGYSKAEALGQNPSMLHSGKQDPLFYQDMWQAIKTSGRWQGEIWNKRKNGEIYPEHLSITAIHDDNGNVSNYIGIFSDISEQLSLQKQLLQAQKMEAVGTLVGGIAHDFNNMLAAISGNVYLVKKKVQDQPKVLNKLHTIEQLSMRSADMIKQLLTFSRQGIVDMKNIPFTLFIKETLNFLSVSVPENIALHQDICSENLLIKGDATQVHQILMNLMNNAVDAVEDVDKPCLTIKLGTFDVDEQMIKTYPDCNAGAYARLSVADNGYGIAQHNINNIFDPFFTTKGMSKGTGLGLAMVIGAIQTHHGFIDVQSTQGQGTIFQIYIPLINEQTTQTTMQTEPQSIEGQGEYILLVDDDSAVRKVMSELLESLGYKVVQAEDGIKAMEVFQAHQQDIALALLDMVMPNCGGMPLAKKIRVINHKLPVIFLTGYDKERVFHDGERLENSEVMTKPADIDALSHSIDAMIRLS